MAVQRWAMVHEASGVVVNVIEWSGSEADWRPPPEHVMVLDEPPAASPGYSWDGARFNPPPVGLPGTAFADPGAVQEAAPPTTKRKKGKT